MTGGVVSRLTVTVNVQVVRLVQLSVAVQTTVVVPTGKGLPEAGEHVTVTAGSALSVAVGIGKLTATVAPVPHNVTFVLAGHEMAGGVVSRATVTRKVQMTTSPHRLVAVQVTVVVPRMNSAPDGGLQTTDGAKVQFAPVVVGTG